MVCSPVATSTPSAIDGGTAHTLPSTTMRRRGSRSAHAPPIGESSRNGRNCATRLSDTANGQPLSSRIAHPSATYWPHVPSCDTPLPSCTSAKSRWRRTRIERGRRDRMSTMRRSCWPARAAPTPNPIAGVWYDTPPDERE